MHNLLGIISHLFPPIKVDDKFILFKAQEQCFVVSKEIFVNAVVLGLLNTKNPFENDFGAFSYIPMGIFIMHEGILNAYHQKPSTNKLWIIPPW